MAIGISGDNQTSFTGHPTDELILIELRTLNNLIQNQSGNAQIADDLTILRNDNAWGLGIPTPVPGN